MYIFINTDLKMKAGKYCAQVGHGVQYITEGISMQNKKTITDYNIWRENGARKILLKATEEQMISLHENYKSVKVFDAGLNHVPAGSFTCLALYPRNHDDEFREFKLL